MMELSDFRKEIDRLDKRLITLLDQRLKLTHEVAIFKKKNNLPVYDQKREADLRKNRKELAAKYNLSQVFIDRLMLLILRESRRRMKEIGG